MTFTEYQDIAKSVAIYPQRGLIGGLCYTALGLGEAGEVQGKVKKLLRDDDLKVSASCSCVSFDKKHAILKELGDIVWYVAEMAAQLDSSLEEVAITNAHSLLRRQAIGTLKGSGDER